MIRGVFLAAGLVALTGCGGPITPSYMQAMQLSAYQNRLDAATYRAVDRILDEMPEMTASNATVVVGSIENIQGVNSSSPFGNIISEMIRTRLVERGIHVQDIRVRSNVLLNKKTGEMLLSRDVKALLPAPGVSDYVTGTYAVASGKVYVSLKIVGAAAGPVVVASDFVTERSMDVDQLVGGG